ncbi:MAG: hypothetical protein QXJ28_02780, partial [Candidatus Pacearchaeota archaeon]
MINDSVLDLDTGLDLKIKIHNPTIKKEINALENVKFKPDVSNINSHRTSPPLFSNINNEYLDKIRRDYGYVNILDPNLESYRAEAQPTLTKVWRGLTQGIINGVLLNIAEAGAFLIDKTSPVPTGKIFGDFSEEMLKKYNEGSYFLNNFLQFKVEELKEGFRETTPIYRRNPGEFDLFENPVEFISSNMENITNTLSFFVPGFLTVKALSLASKIGKIGNASK